jgi:hypothetical protein
MAQNFTDDSYAANHIGQTDLQNMENNFLVLKSCFSGSSAPSSPVAGLLWFDTSTGLLYQRNVANSAWGLITAGALSGVSITAGTGLSGGGELSATRTITHASHTGDVTGSTALTLANNVVKVANMQNGTIAALPSFGGIDDSANYLAFAINSGTYTTSGEHVIKHFVYIPVNGNVLRARIRFNRNAVSGTCSFRLYVGGLVTADQGATSSTYTTTDYSLNVSSLAANWYELLWQHTGAGGNVSHYSFYWSRT